MTDMSIQPHWWLDPDSGELRPDPPGTLPLGSVFVCRGTGLPPLAAAAVRSAAMPWCPLVVVTSREGVLESEPMKSGRHAPGQVVVLAREHSQLPRPSEVAAAVRQRSLPTPARMAGYVLARTDRHMRQELLEACFDVSGTQSWHRLGMSRSEFYRTLAPMGPFTPMDWGKVARVVSLTGSEGHAALTLALERGCGADMIREWLDRYVGVSLEAFLRSPGWEWVLEAVLRRGGYRSVANGANGANDGAVTAGAVGADPPEPAVEAAECLPLRAAGGQ